MTRVDFTRFFHKCKEVTHNEYNIVYLITLKLHKMSGNGGYVTIQE